MSAPRKIATSKLKPQAGLLSVLSASMPIKITPSELKAQAGQLNTLYERLVHVYHMSSGALGLVEQALYGKFTNKCYAQFNAYRNKLKQLMADLQTAQKVALRCAEEFENADKVIRDTIGDSIPEEIMETPVSTQEVSYDLRSDPKIFGEGNYHDKEMAAIYEPALSFGSVTYNNALRGDPNSIRTVSCVWFSKAKLHQRGFATEVPNSFSLAEPKERLLEGSSTTFSGALAKIKDKLDANNNEPLYNIYLEGENHGHTALIDKAYVDEDGNLRIVFSEHGDFGSNELLSVVPNSFNIEKIRPFIEQKEYVITQDGWGNYILPKVWNDCTVRNINVYGSP